MGDIATFYRNNTADSQDTYSSTEVAPPRNKWDTGGCVRSTPQTPSQAKILSSQ